MTDTAALVKELLLATDDDSNLLWRAASRLEEQERQLAVGPIEWSACWTQ